MATARLSFLKEMKNRLPIEILLIINHPTHYHVHLINEIVKTELFDLQVFSYRKTTASHPWTKVFPSKVPINYLYNAWLLKARITLRALVSTKNTCFIIAGWNKPFYILLLNILRLRRQSFILWTDTPRRKTTLSLTAYRIKNAWIRFLFSSKRSFLFVTGYKGVKIASEIWKLNPDQIANFPFVTDHSFFKPLVSSDRNLKDNVIFLSSGRIDFDHKGYDVAISAFKLLLENGIKDFRYYIAGVGPDLSKLERLISEAHLEDHVILLGWVEFDELPIFYNSGHVLLHPSNEDPFPNAILEAMSCGLPVIGSDKAGSAVDRIEPGKNGYLFNAGNHLELAEIISKMIREKESITALGNNALKTARKWHPGFNLQQLETVVKSFR